MPYGLEWKKFLTPYLIFDDDENPFSNNIHPCFPRGYTSNTMFKAIAIALALKYKKIFLFGFDYDFPKNLFLTEKNSIYLIYKSSDGAIKKNYSQIFDSVGHALFWWSQDFINLKKLKSKKIINVTDVSMIDVFKRMNFLQFSNFINKKNPRN